MSLASNVLDLAVRIATESKSLRTLINGNAPSLAALTTTQKASLVAAINEVRTAAVASEIDDAAEATTSTWSSTKIGVQISAATAALVAAAPAALDTLNELAAALGGDANFAATVTSALGNRVRGDATQTFTAPQQAQARTNIGAASVVDVGDTTSDLVATFTAALV